MPKCGLCAKLTCASIMFIIHCPIRVRSFHNSSRCKPSIFDKPFLDYFSFVDPFFSYEKLINRATPSDGVEIFFLKHSHTELSKHELNQNKTGRDRDTVNISETEAWQLQVEGRADVGSTCSGDFDPAGRLCVPVIG